MMQDQKTTFKNLSVSLPSFLKNKNLIYIAKGKRSYVFKDEKGNALKIQREDTEAQNSLEREGKVLRKLNKYKIGPRLLKTGKNYIYYKFVEGTLIVKYLQTAKNSKPLLKDILKQCRILDTLHFTKEEMHKPVKHIFVRNNKATMIDFERCHETNKPKNVTQFIQFLTGKIVNRYNKKQREKLLHLAIEYKKDPSDKNFRTILSSL